MFGFKHIWALWGHFVFVEFAQILSVYHPSHQDVSMTQNVLHAQMTFPRKVNTSFSQERVLVKIQYLDVMWLFGLSRKHSVSLCRNKFIPTFDGLKIKNSEHAFLLSYIFQNPIPTDFRQIIKSRCWCNFHYSADVITVFFYYKGSCWCLTVGLCIVGCWSDLAACWPYKGLADSQSNLPWKYILDHCDALHYASIWHTKSP